MILVSKPGMISRFAAYLAVKSEASGKDIRDTVTFFGKSHPLV
jgi:hypothetical protein